MKTNNVYKLIVSLLVPQAIGIVGALFTTPMISTWYVGISKPNISPPNEIFGPVWTALFLLMGIAVFLVWRRGLEKDGVRVALGIFTVQLSLNLIWSVIFFGMQNPEAAFIEIIFLWIAILANILLFYRISKFAAWLLVPYLAWVSFATYLNYLISVLN